jgi:type 1 glutamine amidotransferase
MKFRCTLFAIFVLVLGILAAEDQQPLRAFIRASAKTHGAGQHDYPRFLAEWKKLLTERGAVANGALRFPTDAELAQTDVLIIYASDGTNIDPEDRSHLETFLKRGGGLVVLHDGICGTNTAWFASIAGGAKQHGEMNWKTGLMKLHFENHAHPIVQGFSDFEMNDEMFFRLQLAPEMKALATSARTTEEIVPQLWVMEKSLPAGRPFRAFVSLQGHNYSSFSLPDYRRVLLRGIAWAGNRPVDLLTKTSGGR